MTKKKPGKPPERIDPNRIKSRDLVHLQEIVHGTGVGPHKDKRRRQRQQEQAEAQRQAEEE